MPLEYEIWNVSHHVWYDVCFVPSGNFRYLFVFIDFFQTFALIEHCIQFCCTCTMTKILFYFLFTNPAVASFNFPLVLDKILSCDHFGNFFFIRFSLTWCVYSVISCAIQVQLPVRSFPSIFKISWVFCSFKYVLVSHKVSARLFLYSVLSISLCTWKERQPLLSKSW